jgi:hypothetical protein
MTSIIITLYLATAGAKHILAPAKNEQLIWSTPLYFLQ